MVFLTQFCGTMASGGANGKRDCPDVFAACSQTLDRGDLAALDMGKSLPPATLLFASAFAKAVNYHPSSFFRAAVKVTTIAYLARPS
jgi:hypothetical protein